MRNRQSASVSPDAAFEPNASRDKRGPWPRITAIWVGALVVGLTAGGLAAPALAGTVLSSEGYYTTAGVNYRNIARISTSTNSAVASTFAGPRTVSVPAGYVASRGRLFTSSGALSCEGSNTYNTVTLFAGDLQYGASCARSTSGTWYSYGVTYAYNGSGYNAYYTFQTANQSS